MLVNEQKIRGSVTYIITNPDTSTFEATTKDAGVWGNVEATSKVRDICIGQVHGVVALHLQASWGGLIRGSGYLQHLVSSIQQQDSTRGAIAINLSVKRL